MKFILYSFVPSFVSILFFLGEFLVKLNDDEARLVMGRRHGRLVGTM